MGLDVAELMIAIEEEFNVEIFEAEAQRIVTLADLADLIEKQVTGSTVTEDEAKEKRAEGLRKARDILSEKTGVDPASLTEDLRLDTLFPLETRSELWNEIRNEFPDGRIPYLENPASCTRIAIFFAEVFLLLPASAAASRYYEGKYVVLFTLIVLIFSAVCLILYGRWNRRPEFPKNCETVIGLARSIVSDTIRLDGDGNVWTRSTIEMALRVVVANEIGVEPEDIDLSVRIDDLF